MRLSGAQAVLRQHQPNTFSLSYYASRLRQDIAERLVKVIPASAQDFVLTVWLGDRRRVAGETYTTFLESGTAHILAVSGVHIGLIYITISYFLRLIIRSPRKRIIITLIAVVLFAFVAGARVSSLRAAIMIGLYLMSEWVDRERDAPTALSLAALIFGIHNPDVIFMAGFQLSFLSIASILLFRPTIEGVFSGLPPALQEGFSTTLSVQLLPLPAALIAFHVLPVAGVLLNLIIIPILSIVLWLAFMTTFSAYLFPPVAQWFAHALVPFVHLIEWLAETTSRLPMSHVYMSKPSTISIIAYFVALGAMWWWLGDKSRQRKPLITAGCAVLIGFVFWTPWSHTPNMTFLDVGHGDAAVIQTEDRKTILIDGGNASDYVDMGKQVVAPYLWNQHTSRIDAIIVYHADSDHVGGLRYVIEHFPVEIVYTAPEFGDTVEGQEFLDVCARSNTPVQTLVAGDVLQMGTARIQVLHPTLESLAPLSDNDRSLVFTLESDGLSALFTGDIESKAEALIFAEHAARVDIIKVPHHGSNTSSTPILFEGVDSQHAIVSSGLRRNKPLAKLEVLQRYRDDGQTVHRSDYAGSIRVEVHDSDVVITHAREIKGISVRE
jgi:competence protein ComEC